MANWVQIRNSDNTVIQVVEWDGISEQPLGPDRIIDSTLWELPGTAIPPVGAVWNGSVFLPPAEEPAPPEDARRKKKGHDE